MTYIIQQTQHYDYYFKNIQLYIKKTPYYYFGLIIKI